MFLASLEVDFDGAFRFQEFLNTFKVNFEDVQNPGVF